MVTLLLNFSLEAENFSFAPLNLFPERCNLNLHVVIASALIIGVVPGVVTLFLEAVERDAVRVLACLELVFLEELLVLKVAVLGLNGVKLVPECEVVLVALLNLKDLCLELTDEQVLLVTRQVHTVVVLSKNTQNYVVSWAYSGHL